MSLLRANFQIVAEQRSGFGAEQILYNRGFFELGRRTDAVAWSVQGENAVIRISKDGAGSEAYFSLAQRMHGNPYMPHVYDQRILPSGDHVALVEKLENPSQKHLYSHIKDIQLKLSRGEHLSAAEVGWYEEMKYAALASSSLRHFFSTENFFLDIDSLPEPQAFREAAIAITELSAEMNKKDPAFLPSPDMNETNVLWRRIDNGLFPVLYDSVSSKRIDHHSEQRIANIVRERLGMNLLS